MSFVPIVTEKEALEMDKKRQVIFTITSLYLKNVTEGGKVTGQCCLFNRSRTIGWYTFLRVAQKCVEEDWPDIDEAGYYNHVVIERVVEGLYNISGHKLDRQTEWWYKYNKGKWIPCEKPKAVKMIVNFGLG